MALMYLAGGEQEDDGKRIREQESDGNEETKARRRDGKEAGERKVERVDGVKG